MGQPSATQGASAQRLLEAGMGGLQCNQGVEGRGGVGQGAGEVVGWGGQPLGGVLGHTPSQEHTVRLRVHVLVIKIGQFHRFNSDWRPSTSKNNINWSFVQIGM